MSKDNLVVEVTKLAGIGVLGIFVLFLVGLLFAILPDFVFTGLNMFAAFVLIGSVVRTWWRL